MTKFMLFNNDKQYSYRTYMHDVKMTNGDDTASVFDSEKEADDFISKWNLAPAISAVRLTSDFKKWDGSRVQMEKIKMAKGELRLSEVYK